MIRFLKLFSYSATDILPAYISLVAGLYGLHSPAVTFIQPDCNALGSFDSVFGIVRFRFQDRPIQFTGSLDPV